MCLRRKKKGKSKVLRGGFCLRDSEAEQRVLHFLNVYCSNINSYSSAPESNKQNAPDRTLGIHFFFCFKHITSLKNLPSPSPSESLPYWFQGNFCGCVCFETLVERISFVCIR